MCRVVAVLYDFPTLFSVHSSPANAVWTAEGVQDPHQDLRTKCGKEEISRGRKATVQNRKQMNLKISGALNLSFQ